MPDFLPNKKAGEKRKTPVECCCEYKFIKTCKYESQELWENHVDKFSKLQKIDKIGRVKIPSFTFTIDTLKIIIESEYVRGTFVGAKYNHILWEDLVMNQDEYTFTDYTLTNFMHCADGEIYSIDLHGYNNNTTLEERIERWKMQRQRRVLSPTGWSPSDLRPTEKLLLAEKMLYELDTIKN